MLWNFPLLAVFDVGYIDKKRRRHSTIQRSGTRNNVDVDVVVTLTSDVGVAGHTERRAELLYSNKRKFYQLVLPVSFCL